MAAAFLLDAGRSRGRSEEFMREEEEEGIQFNMENAAEDIINGMFCTYEPPTSKQEQYKAVKDARKDPKKYAYRPHVPKSILKWKIKKNKKSATPSANAAASFAAMAAAAAAAGAASSKAAARKNDANDGVVDLDEEGNKKSVTWKDEKSRGDRTEIENTVVGLASKYCGGAFNQGEEIAEILSSPTGRATQTFFAGGPEESGSMAHMVTSILKTSKSPTNSDSDKKILYDDEGNPVREDDAQEDENVSFFPSTPKEDTAAATPTAAYDPAADPNLGPHHNLFCSNLPFMDTVKEGMGIAGVMAATAAVAAGVPDNLCSPYKMKRTDKYPTPAEMQISEEIKEAQEALGVYEPASYDQAPDVSAALNLRRQSTPKHAAGSRKHEDKESEIDQQSYAQSDVTMGNTTINHFSGILSLFDASVNESSATSVAKSPKSKASFSSMVEELKHVQLNKNLEGSSQHGSTTGSIKNAYEKMAKSPKTSVVTNSYKNSLKSPSTPKSNKVDLSEVRSGTVASLAKKFESPNGIRMSIDPTECRQFNGKISLLPPTPRRKSPSTPSYSMGGDKYKTFDVKPRQASSEVSANTDAEIREAASTILDVGPSKTASKRPIFAGRRPRSGPETVENDDQDEDRQDHVTTNKTKKKEKKAKMKRSKSKDRFANKFRKVVRKATRNVESQRIAKSEYRSDSK